MADLKVLSYGYYDCQSDVCNVTVFRYLTSHACCILNLFCGVITITVKLRTLKRDIIRELVICMLLFSVKLKLTLLQRPEFLNYNSSCGSVILYTNIIAACCKILTLDLGERESCTVSRVCESRYSHHGDCAQLTSLETQRIPLLNLKSRTNTIVSFPACVPRGPPSRRSGCEQHSEGTD